MSAMERFLSSFVDTLQKQYQKLNFNQFAEVHGYICFESDLGDKERLVLREFIRKPFDSEAISSECSKSVVFQAENAGKKTQGEIELNHPGVRCTATTVKGNGSGDSTSIVNHAVDAIPMCVIDGVWSEPSDHILPPYPSRRSELNMGQKRDLTKSSLSTEQSVVAKVDATVHVNPLGGRESQSNPIKSTREDITVVDDNGNCVESYDSEDFDTDMQVEDDESRPHVKVGLAAAPTVNSNDDPDCIILDDVDPKPEAGILPSPTESQHVLSIRLPVDRGGLPQAVPEQTVVPNSELMIQPRSLSMSTDTAIDSDNDLPEAECIDLDLSDEDSGTSSKSCVRERVSDGDNAQFAAEETCGSSSKNGRAGRKRKRNSSASEAAMQHAVNKFLSYNRCSKTFDPSTVTTERLDAMLFEFFKGARTRTGQPLSASSLQQLQIYLDRVWSKGENRQSTIMITSSKLFPMSTDYLRKICGGKRLCLPKVKDVKTLFHNKKLGSTSPTALLNSMWFMNFKFFGIERPSDHADLEWGDIILKQDEDGTEYLKMSSQSVGSELLRICADPDKPAMCFVSLYKQYADRRPENMNNVNSPFYLMPNSNPSPGASWFQSNKWYIQSFFNIWHKITHGTSLGELF